MWLPRVDLLVASCAKFGFGYSGLGRATCQVVAKFTIDPGILNMMPVVEENGLFLGVTLACGKRTPEPGHQRRRDGKSRQNEEKYHGVQNAVGARSEERRHRSAEQSARIVPKNTSVRVRPPRVNRTPLSIHFGGNERTAFEPCAPCSPRSGRAENRRWDMSPQRRKHPADLRAAS